MPSEQVGKVTATAKQTNHNNHSSRVSKTQGSNKCATDVEVITTLLIVPLNNMSATIV